MIGLARQDIFLKSELAKLSEALVVLERLAERCEPRRGPGRPSEARDGPFFHFVWHFDRLRESCGVPRFSWEDLADTCRYFELHRSHFWTLYGLPTEPQSLTGLGASGVNSTRLADTFRKRFKRLNERQGRNYWPGH